MMNRQSVVSFSAILALGMALLPSIADSQQKSLKDAVVGSWSLTSVLDQYESGKRINHWGAVKGNITFDADGRFSQIIVGDAQPAMRTPDPRKPDAPVVAYYGSYTVNEGNTVSFKIEGASYSARVGAPFTSTVEINGDAMTLIGSPRKDQVGTFTPRLELKRAN
jgi:Lipocalin-like domain